MRTSIAFIVTVTPSAFLLYIVLRLGAIRDINLGSVKDLALGLVALA